MTDNEKKVDAQIRELINKMLVPENYVAADKVRSSDELFRTTHGVVNATNASTENSNLTAASIAAAAIEKFKAIVDHQHPWSNIQIRSSYMATALTDKPRVVHRKRWFHTQRYHERAQARLIADHGFVAEPCIYLVDPSAAIDDSFIVHHHQQAPYLVVHPSLYDCVAQAVNNGDFATLRSMVNRLGKTSTNRDK